MAVLTYCPGQLGQGVAKSPTWLKHHSMCRNLKGCISMLLLFSFLLSRVQLFCDPMDCSPPGSSVHGIFQARILEWVATSFSRGSFLPRDRNHVSWVSCSARRILHHCTAWEAPASSVSVVQALCPTADWEAVANHWQFKVTAHWSAHLGLWCALISSCN